MTSYRADFDRISRNHDVPPLNVGGAYEGAVLAQVISEQVYAYAKPKVASRNVNPSSAGCTSAAVSSSRSWDHEHSPG